MVSKSRRVSSSIFSLVALATLAAVAGCGSKGVVGKWTGSIPGIDGKPAPMAVEFKSDGTEDQTATVMGHAVVVHSTYVVKDDSMTETIATVTLDGRAMPAMPSGPIAGKTEEFKFKLDGDTLTLTSGSKPPVVLTRAAK